MTFSSAPCRETVGFMPVGAQGLKGELNGQLGWSVSRLCSVRSLWWWQGGWGLGGTHPVVMTVPGPGAEALSRLPPGPASSGRWWSTGPRGRSPGTACWGPQSASASRRACLSKSSKWAQILVTASYLAPVLPGLGRRETDFTE